METHRVRVSLQSGDLEVEGSESFVSQYRAAFDALISRLGTATVAAPRGVGGAGAPASAQESDGTRLPFPEVLHGLPKGASGTDQILLAGKFASERSSDGTFSTAEASSLLVEQGVKLSNPSQSMKNNLNVKRVFKVGSRWKVSKIGDDYLRTVMPH